MEHTSPHRSSPTHTNQLVSGYQKLVCDRLNQGWQGYILSFMFDRVGGPERAVRDQMASEVERVYGQSLTRIVHNPRSLSWKPDLPVWIACPDYPVPKHSTKRLADVALNDGLHFGAIALVSPRSRLDCRLDTHFFNNARLYVQRDYPLRSVMAVPTTETPEVAIEYVLKALERGRITSDHILILPREP